MDPSGAHVDAAVSCPPAGDPNPMPSDEHDVGGQGTLAEYEEELPVYLSLLKDLPSTTSYDLPEDQLHHMPDGNKDSAWQKCLESVETYDRELCQTYREQIDTLLVFAGLFSAVVTAFAVESYQWLQDDPSDTSVELLRDMVALLSQNLNVTAPPTPVSPSRLSGSAVTRINCFWFLSLSLSLSAALVGILCKQWLREFERNVGQSPERALAVRYIRFQGLEYWNVGSIVISVPVIMQMALAFFMIGVIELLWRLHVVVACCVTAVSGLTLVFFLVTTFLPAIQYAYISARCCMKPLGSWEYITRRAFTEPQCAFKSPQAWLVLRILHPVIEHLFKAHGPDFSFRPPPLSATVALHPADSWNTFDINWVKRREHMNLGPQCAFRTLDWVARNLGDLHLSSSIWHCVWARWLKNRDYHGIIAVAALDIAFVAQSYPNIVPLGFHDPQSIKAQALVFQCSLRTDLPVETAIELLLRVAPVIGVNSQWTREALRAVLVTYEELTIRISDGLAIRLFRLAETQTHTLLLHPEGLDEATQLNAALAFKDILAIIHRASRLRNPLMAAMSALALQWLRANPPPQIALVARWVFEDMMTYLATRAYYCDDWRRFPGITLVAKLAEIVSSLWPHFVRDRYSAGRPGEPPVLQQLLALASRDGRPDLTPERRDSGNATSPDSGSIRCADGERSNPPERDAHVHPNTAEEVRTRPYGSLSSAAGTSISSGQARMRIQVRDGDLETDAVATVSDGHCPVSPQSTS